jgi:hypothetical protein
MSSVPPPPPAHPQPPPIEFPPGLEVEYVNLVRIAHSPSELVFDFSLLLPGMNAARVSSRIVMSVLGAKLFYQALAENLARYEAAYGEIRGPNNPSTLADQLFHPPSNPDNPKPD